MRTVLLASTVSELALVSFLSVELIQHMPVVFMCWVNTSGPLPVGHRLQIAF